MNQTEERSIYSLFIEDELFLVSLTPSQISLIDWLIKEQYFNDLLRYEKLENTTPIVI